MRNSVLARARECSLNVGPTCRSQLPAPAPSLPAQQAEADRLRMMEELDRMEAASSRERLPTPADFRRLCFRATDIVQVPVGYIRMLW